MTILYYPLYSMKQEAYLRDEAWEASGPMGEHCTRWHDFERVGTRLWSDCGHVRTPSRKDAQGMSLICIKKNDNFLSIIIIIIMEMSCQNNYSCHLLPSIWIPEAPSQKSEGFLICVKAGQGNKMLQVGRIVWWAISCHSSFFPSKDWSLLSARFRIGLERPWQIRTFCWGFPADGMQSNWLISISIVAITL